MWTGVLGTASLQLEPHLWALLGDLGSPAHSRTQQSLPLAGKPAQDLLDSVGQLWGEVGSENAQGWGLETFQRRRTSRLLSPREQKESASREKLVQGKGSQGCGLPTRPRAAPTCPATSPAAAPGGEPGNRAAGTRRRSPPSLAGPTGTGRRVLTLAGGAGRGRTAPRAAPIR